MNLSQTTHPLREKCGSGRGRAEVCPFSPLARCLWLHSPALVSNSLPSTTEKQIPSKKSVQKTSAIAEFASRLFSANLSDSPQLMLAFFLSVRILSLTLDSSPCGSQLPFRVNLLSKGIFSCPIEVGFWFLVSRRCHDYWFLMVPHSVESFPASSTGRGKFGLSP